MHSAPVKSAGSARTLTMPEHPAVAEAAIPTSTTARSRVTSEQRIRNPPSAKYARPSGVGPHAECRRLAFRDRIDGCGARIAKVIEQSKTDSSDVSKTHAKSFHSARTTRFLPRCRNPRDSKAGFLGLFVAPT
jgi:hypothetical protein